MPRPLRLIAVVAGLLLVVAVAGLIVVQSQLSPARLQEALERAVRRSTGRDLTIAGGIHLRMGLAPALEVDGVSLANLPGASRPQMLTAASLKANLALLPLLGGDVVIGALTVEQPDILLERLPDGTANWQFSPVRRALYQGAPAGGGGSGGGGRVEIRSITLKDGKLGWREASGQVLEFGIQHLDLASEGADQPMTLSAAVTHGGAPVAIEASSGSLERLQGEAVSKLAGTWPLTVDLTAQDASLHLDGGVNHPDEWRGYQFKVRGSVPDLAALDAVVPGTTLPALKQLAFSAVLLDGTEGALRTAQLAAQAGASDLGALVPGLLLQHLDLKAPGPGQIAQLSLDGSYSGAPMRASATAMQPDALTAARPIQVTLTAQSADATADIHGTVPPSQAAAGLDLLVSLHAADLSQLSALAGRTLPPAHDLAFSAHATDAGFRLHGVSLGDIALTSSLGDLSGMLTVGWTPRPTLNGTLASNSLDVDALWPAISEAARRQEAAASLTPPAAPEGAALAQPEAVPEPAAWDPLPGLRVPVAALRAADGDLTLTVGSLIAGGERYRDLATHIQLAGGKLAINPFRLSAPQGIVVGGTTIDASTDTPPVAVTMRSAALSASAVAGLLGEPGGAHGTMQLDAQLSGTGATSEALAATLDGHLGLAMVNGDIDNALVQTLVGSALDAAGAPSLGGGRSQVRCLALRLNISGGQGRLAAFALDTSRLSVDGTGSIDFAGRTLDLHLKPRLRLGGADASAPVSITGSFDAPSTKLDPVIGGSRFGFTIGSGADFDAGSTCVPKLAEARGGMPGPMPAPSPALPDAAKALRKLPTDLLRGLFH
jgi:AsmA protein